jgi:hypothetical protein
MRILSGFVIALATLASGCGVTSEPECGLYDFSCDDTPQSAPLISAPATASAAHAQAEVAGSPAPKASPATPAAAAAPERSLDARIRALEIQVDTLTRRLDALSTDPHRP